MNERSTVSDGAMPVAFLHSTSEAAMVEIWEWAEYF